MEHYSLIKLTENTKKATNKSTVRVGAAGVAVIGIIVLFLVMFAVERIDSGQTGIIVNLAGSERGVDDAGFGRIRSKGDQALFGGFTTKQMKDRLGVQDKRPLADFLPTLTIAAKNLATEMTNYNVEEKDLQGESAITVEHVENNTSVRDMLGQRGIKPEDLPASEDIKKLERRVKREEKKLAEQSGKLTNE